MKKKMETAQTDSPIHGNDEVDLTIDAMNHEENRSDETNERIAKENADKSSSEESDMTYEERLEAQIDDLKDQLLRKAAEMENMRKRMQRDRTQIFDQSKAAAIEAFLPVNDDLQRTLDALKTSNPDPAFLDGIQMVADKFESVLGTFGVEKIAESHVPFDVNLHEALMRQPAPNSSVESDTVLQVLENGYRIGEKIIRHAKVIVSE